MPPTSPEARDVASIGSTFRRLRERGRRAFIPYVTAGYPRPADTPAILEMLAVEGADLIELGVPFSDPLADGPTIQRAAWQALGAGVTLPQVLDWTEGFSRSYPAVPVVLFSYLNPILRYGPERFVADAREVGAAGLLITDLPVAEDTELEEVLSGELDLVRLVAPTTERVRVEAIVRAARGFIYYISRTGVTGERAEVRRELSDEVQALRAMTELPIAVGFGISTFEQARLVASVADGVVVGSALVRALGEGGLEAARPLARTLREGVDAATS